MTPLGRALAALVREEGPISLERYVALCLAHPRLGYYMTRDPLGRGGDFTTSPEISQMFGELLGLWVAETWAIMGRPSPCRLVEFGPGRGTLMADALRALRAVPECRAALSVHLVETSPVLAGRQRARLAGSGVPVTWHEALRAVPPGPAICLANEFLDALPIRQFVRAEAGWHERLVGLSQTCGLAFGLAEEPDRSLGRTGSPGDVVETCAPALAIARELGARLRAEGGAALFIDYGHVRSGFGDTLQAVQAHAFVDPLATPGEADITAHVDFEAFGRAAGAAGAVIHGPVTQATFLDALGIGIRARALQRTASASEGEEIERALDRLAGTGAGRMGELFKVMAVAAPSLPTLPALPCGATDLARRDRSAMPPTAIVLEP